MASIDLTNIGPHGNLKAVLGGISSAAASLITVAYSGLPLRCLNLSSFYGGCDTNSGQGNIVVALALARVLYLMGDSFSLMISLRHVLGYKADVSKSIASQTTPLAKL